MTKISNQYSLTNILTADLANSRLGINNVSPTVALDVTGAGKFSGNVVLSGSDSRFNGGDSVGRLILSNSNTTTYIGLYGATHPTLPYIMSFVVNSASALAIASTGAATFSGSVTASDLIISDTYANDPLIKLASTTSGSVEVQLRTATTTYNPGIGVVTSGYDFNFFTANSTRMTITSAGNVGIGTSSPGYSLHVNGTAYAVGHIGGYVTASSGFVNETQTITTNGTSYYLRKYTGNANGSSTTIFNITGLNTANGTFADIYAVAQKDATGSAINTNLEVQINGQYMYGIQANGTAANTRICAFKVCRMDSSWVIIGTVRT